MQAMTGTGSRSEGAGLLERPRVVVSATASADGRTALSRASTLMEPQAAAAWRSLHPEGAGELLAQRKALLESRYHPRVILEGSGTFVTEDAPAPPALPDPDLDTDAATLRTSYLPGESDGRWFVVVDSRGRIRWTHTGQDDTQLLVLVTDTTPAAYLAYLRRQHVPYLVAGHATVDLALALHLLRARLGAECVVSEAGGGLNGALLRAGLVDELHLVLLPSLVGGRETPTAFDGPPLGGAQTPTPLRLRDVHFTTDGAVWLHYDADTIRSPSADTHRSPAG